MNKTVKSVIPYILITILGGLLYFHIRDFKFTYLDDAAIVIGTYKKVMSDPLCVLHVFTKNMFYSSGPQIYYRPVFDLSFILNDIVSRNNLSDYYFTNIFFPR